MEKKKFLTLLPEKTNGWLAADEGMIYDQHTLYDYIDGGAELYISYGFVNVFSIRFLKPDNPSIYIEIFDMGKPEGAFGVFSNSKEKINAGAGTDGQYIAGSLMFWKDRLFISVFCDYETPDSKDVLFRISEDISTKINKDTERPFLLKCLPEDYLSEESIVYFFHHAWQNYYFYLSDDNIFNISEQNDAVLAKYVYGENIIIVLIVHCINETTLKNNIQNVKLLFSENSAVSENSYFLKNGKYALIKGSGDYFYMLLGKENDNNINILSNMINQKIKLLNYG